jgi:hypothetical protein
LDNLPVGICVSKNCAKAHVRHVPEQRTLNTPNSYLLVGLRLISYSAVDIRFPTRPQPAPCLNQFWHFTITRGPNKGNASQEIDCENKQPDRSVCSRVFCASSLAAFAVSLSAPIPNCFGVGTKCNKNVTGNIDCLSLTWKRKNLAIDYLSLRLSPQRCT